MNMTKLMFKRLSLFVKNNFVFFFSLYFIAMFLETTTVYKNFNNVSIVINLLKFAAYLLFLLRLILIIPDYRKKIYILKTKDFKYFLLILIVSTFLVLSLILTFIHTGNKKYIMILLIIISSYGTSFLSLTTRLEKLQIVCTTILVFLSVCGFVDNYIIYRENGLLRNSLGFGYVSNLSQMIMCIVILHLFNLDFNENNNNLLYLQFLNICIYFITNSKAEFLIVELVLLCTYIYNNQLLKNICINAGKKLLIFFCKIFWTLPLLSLILVITYKINPASNIIDKTLSNRIKYPYAVLDEYGISLFGNDIQFIGNGIKDREKYPNKASNYVDNEYLKVMFTNGIIFFVSEILILSIYLFNLKKFKKYKYIFISLIFMIFALLNPRLSELIYCPILFLAVKTLIDRNQIDS